MVTIILLNYNGWRDTIKCLESLLKQTTQDWRAVVADNGSQDESMEQLKRWIAAHQAEKQICLLPLETNYGFAKGNNLTIEAAQKQQSDYYWILNNDTIVESDCLERLVRYMDTHPDITAVTPAIRLYDRPDYLWNAGGRLVFGGRRYYGASQPAACFEGKQELPITFITGCALLVRRELIEKEPLFTERFFFGEEDFNFSLRMKQAGKKMMCLPDAIIYHKVGAAQAKIISYNKLFIYLLNRIIDLRLSYPSWKYALWIKLYIPMVKYKFLKGLPCQEKHRFIGLLKQEATNNDGVSRELYTKYINYPFHHD